MYCPSHVSCFDNSWAGETVYYTLCEWGTNSNCETGEGCCWDYELVVPDCSEDCIEPTITFECIEGQTCLLVNGLSVPNHIWGTNRPPCVTGVGIFYNVFKIDNPSCNFQDIIRVPDCSLGGSEFNALDSGDILSLIHI